MTEAARVKSGLRASRYRLPTFISLLFAFVGGCTAEQRDSTPDLSTLTVHYPGNEWVLGPYEDEVPKFLVFLPLVARDENGEIEGRLARSWEHSSDYATWTFHLHTDVAWHDGVPVTARDVAFTYELWKHPGTETAGPEDYDVTVLNDSTVQITYYNKAYDPLDTWQVFYPEHLLRSLDPEDYYRWEFWKQPIGNGPYRYVRHVPKIMVELEANPAFFEGKPAIERLVLTFGGSNRLPELLSGHVDAIAYLHLADHKKLADDPRFRSYYGPPNPLVLNAIYWNHHSPLFRDARVRRALTLAINRRELLQMLDYPDDTPVVDGVFTAGQLLRGELPEALPYDTLLADSLLADAGWTDADGDGVRQRDGVPFEFQAIVASHSSLAASLERASVLVQAQLRRIGVRMGIQSIENITLQGRLAEGDFDAAFYLVRNAPKGVSYRRLVSPESIIGYANPELRRLLDAAYTTLDEELEGRLQIQASIIMLAEMPITILFPLREGHVAHRRVGGLLSPYRSNPAQFADRLWIEERSRNTDEKEELSPTGRR